MTKLALLADVLDPSVTVVFRFEIMLLKTTSTTPLFKNGVKRKTPRNSDESTIRTTEKTMKCPSTLS